MSKDQAPHPTLLCRAHLHHKWVEDHTSDGQLYHRCAHCGKDRTEVDSNNFGGKVLGAGLGGFGGG
ncbi:MAG TPA: hypothetical protein VFU35_01305 [Jatrophihabitans sp.]|nr:hypothetical protein [Jatrophihabitans sp.]